VPRHHRVLACVLALLLLAAGASPALAARKARCPRGTLPVLKGSGSKAKLVKTRGKVRCTKPAKPRKAGFPRPSTAPRTQLAVTAAQLDQALAVNPAAFDAVSRRIGAARTAALTKLARDAWKQQASAARARTAADDNGLHVNQTFGDGTGPTGTFKLDAGQVTNGGKLGLEASATLEIGVTAEGLDKIASGALPAGTSAKAKVEITFADVPNACPTAAGKVSGNVKGTAKVTLTVIGPDGKPQTVFASAEMDVDYQLTVGENARWETIDKVDAKSTFSYGGSGKGTETWRGRRVGGGFGQKSILSGDFSAGIAEAYTHFDQSNGGIFGPHTSIKYSTGPTAWDIQSISNLKGLIVTQLATDYLTLAAVEYVRGVVAPRLQKHWYDDEACLRLEGSPATTKLKAGQQTKVTTKNAKSAGGEPVKTNLTATGVAKLLPGSAVMPAGAKHEFTLTAPNATPTHSSWKVVALSRAGKKTVDGTLDDQPGYEVTLANHEVGDFATHGGAADFTGTLRLVPVAGADPARWQASGPVTFGGFTTMSKIPECSLRDPVHAGTWTVTVTQTGPDTIKVDLDFTKDTQVLWTFHCVFPPDPGSGSGPVINDQPGLPTASAVPIPKTFTLPVAGGAAKLDGAVVDAGDGFTSSGTLTVTPVG
jgi:hypothetical protein